MSASLSCSLVLLVSQISGSPGLSDPCFTGTKIYPAQAPFKTLPDIKEIVNISVHSDDKSESACDKKKPCQSTQDCNPCALDAIFTKAARFPVNEFGTCGQVYETNAAIIYEDMVLQSQGDGRYLVKFVVETPGIDVTMRLQFVIQKKQDCPENKSSHHNSIGTITLPPIRIKAKNSNGRCWLITHQGYSSLLNQDINHIRGNYKVIRRGTARFGSMPQTTAY